MSAFRANAAAARQSRHSRSGSTSTVVYTLAPKTSYLLIASVPDMCSDGSSLPTADSGPPRVLTNADDRLPLASLGRVEGGDGSVESRDVADVRPQSSGPHPLDDLIQLGNPRRSLHIICTNSDSLVQGDDRGRSFKGSRVFQPFRDFSHRRIDANDQVERSRRDRQPIRFTIRSGVVPLHVKRE
jgi:hypothetical protein